MKKLVLLTIAVIALSSCGTLRPREMQKQVMFIDYTPYVEAGFYLSPNDYPGPHTPVGELNIIIDPSVERMRSNIRYDDGIYQTNNYEMASKNLTADELLEIAVSEAAKKGSNGISNLKIEVVTMDYPYYVAEGLFTTSTLTMPVNRYIITGLVIRINN